MSKAPAFQFYAQDFLTGTMYLTNEEIGIYIKMLAKQWTDGDIPIKRLGFLVGFEWVDLGEELQSKFKEKDGFLVNLRLEREREKSASFRKKQAENGKKGGRPRKSKPSESIDSTDDKPRPLIWDNPNDSQKKPLEDEVEDEVEVEKEVEDEVEVEKEVEVEERKLKTENLPAKKKEDKVNYAEIKDFFNNTCVDLPKIRSITSKRKALINKIAKEHGFEEIGNVFRESSKSSFLSGDNKNGWNATFDWILNPNNFIKILEGNYKNNGKTNGNNNQTGGTTDEYRLQVARRLGIVS